jgi:3-phosphoshikimate 1-carboxyvinyltransferase
MTLPGDISAAAFLIVAALMVPGSEIILQGVGLNPTRTGLLDALSAMGADLQIHNRSEQGGEPAGDLTVRYSRLHATQVNGPLVVRMIDEFPAFAVAAALAEGITTVSEAEELRHKESDRISALCGELRRLGVQAQEAPDGFRIHGGRSFQGGSVEAHGDHRLALSLAVAGLAAQAPVTIQGAEMMAESYPEFVDALNALGAQASRHA